MGTWHSLRAATPPASPASRVLASSPRRSERNTNMANDSGLNTSEVQEALEAAKSAGNEEVRYFERVLESRGVRKANVSSHEIVAGNPEAYPEETVRQQEDLAEGRPNEPVKADDLGVRGSEPAGDDGGDTGDQPKKAPAK